MNLSGDILKNYSWIWIKQQLPLRLYIWYSKKNTNTISINKINYLDFYEYNFIEANAMEYAPYFSDINRFLKNKYQDFCEQNGGFEINILSELPRWVGLWFGSILALWLSVLMNKITWNIDNYKIIEMKNKNINEQLNDEYSDFYKIFTDALEFDKQVYGMLSSWTKLASFFFSYYPIISFSEDHIENWNTKSQKRYFGFKLNDLYPDLREVPYAPIDYGIIYSGKPVLLEQIAGDNYKSNWAIAKEINNEMEELFWDFLGNIHPKHRPKFYKDLVEPGSEEFAETYSKMMWVISLKMLYFLARVYHRWYDESSVLSLLDTFKKLRQADCVTRDSSHTFLRYIKEMLEKFPWPSKYFSLAPNDSTIMWWSVIFMLPLEWFRNSVMWVVEGLSQTFSGSKLIYTNWLDWLAYEWCKIEQDLSQNIYSEFLDGRNCTIKSVAWKIMIGDCNRLIENKKTWILLDKINNKIYINWKRPSSKEIPSQTATIEVLSILIENIWKEISNKDLPKSSYSKNKNDMIGKIVVPLISLVEKKTKKKLPLICVGSLYDYVMRLEQTDIEINIVSPIC